MKMSIRRQLGYPPYYFTIGITLSHKKEGCQNVPTVMGFCAQVYRKLKILDQRLNPSHAPATFIITRF